MTELVVLSFAAGFITPLNPCGFALLPAYLTAATATAHGRNLTLRLLDALRGGLLLTGGFVSVFIVAALAVTFGLRPLLSWTPWLVVALGALLVVTGIALLVGIPVPVLTLSRTSAAELNRSRGMFAFGVTYAVASLSCALPALVALAAQTLAATSATGLLAVLAGYAVGAASLLLLIAIATALTTAPLTRLSRRLLPYASRIAGIVLLATGTYLVLFWVPALASSRRPDDRVWTQLSSTISEWIITHSISVALTATVFIALITLIAFATRRRAT